MSTTTPARNMPLPRVAGGPAASATGRMSPAGQRSVRRRRGAMPVVDAALLHALAIRAIDAGSGGLTAVGLTSVVHGEGATTIACGLSACVATTLGQRVVLVDANLRSPMLRTAFALEPGPGLADVLGGGISLESALRAPAAGPLGDGRLLVLPASQANPDNPALLSGPAMRDLIAELHGYAEVLVFDTAPVQLYPDTTMLARHLDGVVVVLRSEHAKWDDSEQAVQALRDSGANVLGAVLNRQKAYIPRLLDRLL
jgi:succinoglycan biosynthesis transport protein ExoP